MALENIIELITETLGDEVIEDKDLSASPQALIIKAEHIEPVCALLHAHDSTYFDMLSCITGVDNGPEAGTMEVIYNLYSIPYDGHLMLKCLLKRPEREEDMPSIATLSGIWRTADWLERETYDLLGINFEGHPDQRRILLPADWEGFPLRKDYQHQEYYHGIKVEY